jgi:hypothetical protein
MCNGGNGHELRSLSRTRGNSSYTTFQRSNSFLEDIDSRLHQVSWKILPEVGGEDPADGLQTYVHNPTVDVSEFLQSEESCTMSRVIEGEGLISISAWQRKGEPAIIQSWHRWGQRERW